MHSSRSNLLTNFNFTRGTEIGKGGPLLAAKISPGGTIIAGGIKIFATGQYQRLMVVLEPVKYVIQVPIMLFVHC